MYRGRGVLDYSIPDSYVELEYIHGYYYTTINPYIDTKLTLDKGYRILAYLYSEGKNPNLRGAAYGTGTGLASNITGFYHWYGYTITRFNKEGEYDFDDIVVNNYDRQNFTFLINSYHVGNSETLYNTWGRSGFLRHKKYIVYNDKGVYIAHLIPVRRLGDGICGMFDTINQKFYSSEAQVQFQGSSIKYVNKERFNSKLNYIKNNIYNRIKKSYISNTIYSSSNDYYYQLNNSNDIISNNSSGYNYNRNRLFSMNYFIGSGDYGKSNINPNYNIDKRNDYVDIYGNNEELYIDKKRINVYNTGTTTPASDDGYLE